MNREIKFRAWDGKKMLLNVGIHPHLCSDLSHDDEYYKDNQDGRWIIGLGFDSYKVMQYTGLKDKNGKEIYEFDYVIDQLGQRILVEYEFSLLSRLKDIEKYLIIDGNLYE